jgi:uncharacterized protein with HEPN domain
MPRRDPRIALVHMLDHSKEIVEITCGKTRADLDTDRCLNLALVRLLEIVGEAANRVPQEERDQYPQIPWFEVISVRNRLIHGYDMVDFDILWQITTQDIPKLVNSLDVILASSEL